MDKPAREAVAAANEERGRALHTARQRRRRRIWLGLALAVTVGVAVVLLAGNVYRAYPVWYYAVVVATLVFFSEWSVGRWRYLLESRYAENAYDRDWHDATMASAHRQYDTLFRRFEHTEKLLTETNGRLITENRQEVQRRIIAADAIDEIARELEKL